MVNYVPLNSSRHAGKAWRRSNSYAFASAEAVVPLLGAEFGKAAVAMPIAFIEQSGGFMPIAVMSPVPGRNLFIGPAGQWLGGYVPATLRSYPFRLVRVEGREESAICICEDSGLVVEADGTAEDFYDAEGNPSQSIKIMMSFLTELERNRTATDPAVVALADAGLIQPWPLQVTIDGKGTTVNGLHRIDEAALNALDGETFLELRKASALPLAYMQLLSMGQVDVFGRLNSLQQKLAPRQERPFSLDEIFATAKNDTIRFN